tara:strand:+ start:118 stop:1038 length:921 start_codon:yes stop_codon:yes gene_type:complete
MGADSVASILLLGADGQVARAARQDLASRGYDVIGTTRRASGKDKGQLFLDFSRPPEEWPELPDVNAAVICTAITGIRDCEADPAGTSIVNLQAPVALAEMLCRQGIFALFLSSAGVFDFQKSFRRHDERPSPITNYGRQKAEAEEKILGLDGKTAVLRLTKVMGPDMPLINSWSGALGAGQRITAFHDTMIAPITPEFTSRMIHEIVHSQEEGIFHASGDEDVPYTELAGRLVAAIGADAELVTPVKGDMPGHPAGYPHRYTTLDMSRETELFGIEPPSVRDTIDGVVSRIACKFPSETGREESS